ncbi:nephrin isoform X2 [Clupea harengus]|uniref:Nephrin isoform X2 n=1 Tax=Clupea harengus TaxID=7950 RepID=A0A6P8FXT4_CLUHA|nr:nephrin isoform X2 [Clupea harengus]
MQHFRQMISMTRQNKEYIFKLVKLDWWQPGTEHRRTSTMRSLLAKLPGSRCFLLPFTLILGMQAQQAFRTQPRNVTVQAGTQAQLKCQVLRATGPVQWVKDGLLLGPQRSLPGFPRYRVIGDKRKGEYHLLIEDVALEDDALYECQAGQSDSSSAIISQTAWLNVQIPPLKPYIELESNEPWVAGKEYTVMCTASDAKPAAEITLFKGGIQLLDLDSVTMSGSEEQLMNTQAEVRVKAESADHGGELVCKARNSALTTAMIDTKVMTVYFPPQAPVIEGLDITPVKAGDILKLSCLSHGGNPLASLYWTKNGELLSSSWEEDVVQRRSRSLLFLELTAEDNQAILHCESLNQVSQTPLFISHMLTVFFEPVKVNLLGTFEAVEGQTVAFCCHTSSSNPPVEIRWWLGFRELNTTLLSKAKGENGGMTTMSNLTHTVSREENGLLLSCEAFNKGTQFSSSTSKILHVFYPPHRVWLHAPPEDVTLKSGHPVHLTCFSTGGNPTGQLTWFKNGRVIQGSSKQVSLKRGVSLELRFILQPSDNLAIYRCDVTNLSKKLLSAKTRLKVQFASIHVEIQVKPKVLRRGKTVSLDCLCGSSNPKANASWSVGFDRLAGVEMASRPAEYGGVSFRSNLSLTLTSQHHQQRVTCKAFSKLLSEAVSSSYTLNVLFPPEFSSEQPKEVKAVENDEVSLPLMVSANPTEMTCDWIFHGKKLDKETEWRYCWDDGFVLKIRNVTRNDAGVYNVECANEEGHSHTSTILNISYAPTFRMKPDVVFVDIGGTVDLLCEVEANPVISGMFSWKWLGNGEIDVESQHEDDTTGWLTLFQVTRAHTGTYQCTVDNDIPPAAAAEVQLVVRFKPQLKKGPQWSKVASRADGVSTVDIACQAEGVPKVDFSWAKNKMPMDFANPRYMENTVRVGVVHTSTLSIENVSATLDYAVFTCTASNSLGEDSLDIQLLNTNHPESPSDLRLLHVSNYSVTLEWKPGFDGGLTQKFRIRYLWKGFSSYHYVDVFPPKATFYTVTGLLPATTYNFSVNAVNNMGESSYADGNTALTVTTRGKDPAVDLHPPGDSNLTQESFGVWHYLSMVTVGVVILFTVICLSCVMLVRWRKDQKQTDVTGSVLKGSKTDTEGSLNVPERYINTELMSTATSATASTIETNSTVYESYAGENGHYYSTIEESQPTFYTHMEGAEHHGPFGHDYEEVTNEEMQLNLQNFLPISHHSHPPLAADPCRGNQQQSFEVYGKDIEDVDYAWRNNGPFIAPTSPTMSSQLLFELGGELV